MPEPLPAVNEEMSGIPGTVAGVTEDVLEAVPVPFAFTAETRTSYEVPLVNPLIVYDKVAADAE